ncbi:MAG: multidrug efflux system outer membrane protein [Verrucomicrobiales bacterium]|jgi:multidrug efflux system outer membrane protein
MLGQPYQQPSDKLEVAFKGAGFKSPEPEGSWWLLFDDRQLSRYIEEVETENHSARAALARYQQAQAALGIVSSDAFPSITGETYARRQGDSSNSNFSVGTYNDYRAALNLSWEIDLWGRVRRSVNAATADEEAAGYDLQATLLSLRAEVALAYLSLRFADSEIALLEETAKLRAEARRLMKVRFDAGESSSLDYNRAVTEHESVQSELHQLRAQRGKFENAIAALTGRSASGFSIKPIASQPKVPTVPSAVPSDLLRRRPDIAAAERRLAAASERIGVVIASYLPSISINGYAGLQSLKSSDLFDPASKLWSLGPELGIPIFQAGRSGGDKAKAEAAYREALENYRDVLDRAVQETEDSLGDARHLAKASTSRKRGATSAASAADLTRKRYAGGVSDYFEVVDAERTAVAENRATLGIDLARSLAATRLIQALGGGWKR